MFHHGPIAGVATHGNLVATAGYDNKLILWDVSRRRALARASHDHLVNHCAFSADGQWLVSASSDYSARIWSVPSLRLHAVLPGHGDDVDMAAFSPDDRLIATCALDRCVRIFDRQGHCLHTMPGHTGNVLSLAWMQDSRHVVSSSVDGTIRSWDSTTGTALGTTDLQVRTDTVEIGADGRIYAGDDRGRIAIISEGVPTFFPAHRAGIKKIALNTQQETLVALSYDRTISVWHLDDASGLKEIARADLPADIWARAAAVLDDGRIAVGTFGSTFALFDPQTSIWNMEGVAPGHAINAVLAVESHVYTVGDAGVVNIDGHPSCAMGSLCNFLVAADGNVLTGGQLGQLLDADSGQVLYQHHSPLNCGVAFEHQGKPHVAVGTYTGEILIFVATPAASWQLLKEIPVYANAIKGLSFSNGLLFSVCASTDIAWHDVNHWLLVERIEKAHERIANACCTIGPGRFASVGRDRSLRLWDGKKIERHESQHPNSIKCIAADAAQTMLLTGSYGGTLALFDLQRRCWTAFTKPTIAGISSIAWDEQNHQFLAASYDGQLYTVPI